MLVALLVLTHVAARRDEVGQAIHLALVFADGVGDDLRLDETRLAAVPPRDGACDRPGEDTLALGFELVAQGFVLARALEARLERHELDAAPRAGVRRVDIRLVVGS